MENDILNYLVENGKINLQNVKAEMLMSKRIEYLKMHEYKIWQGTDGMWCTYIPDRLKTRKLVKKKTREEIEDKVVEYYRESVSAPYFDEIFYLWVNKKLEYGEIQKQTYERYKLDFLKFIEPTSLCKMRITKIDEFTLEDFSKTTIKNFELTAKAWSNIRTIIIGCFKLAKKKGYTELSITNALSDIDISKKAFRKVKQEPEDNIWTNDEIDKLKKYLMKNRITPKKLAILTVIYTGLRSGEVVALKKEDIHKDYIYVHRTQVVYHDENGKRIVETRDSPKTDAAVRKIGITKPLEPILKRAMLMSDNEMVFSGEKGFIQKGLLNNVLYECCERLGIRKKSMHTLRKTFATNLIDAGVPKSTITYIMGHTDIATTEKYYYFPNPDVNELIKSVQNAINY